MTDNIYAERISASLIGNYRQYPVMFDHGEGVWLWDKTGKQHLDMAAGIATSSLGHGHPDLVQAIAQQAKDLIHVSNLYCIDRQIELAEKLKKLFGQGKSFFCNSGAEANEAAIKLARRYHHVCLKKPRDKIVTMYGSFHGRSVASVSITGQEKYQQGFGALFGPVEIIPYNDIDAAKHALSGHDVCALIVEPIQGEGGIRVPDAGYLSSLRTLANETDTVLIFDEVQTGIGRTGCWFAGQHDLVTPDVMTLAKGIAGGVSIGAMMASDHHAQGLALSDDGIVPHASTFGGNPLSCMAALTVLNVIERDHLVQHASDMGMYMMQLLTELAKDYPLLFGEVRGRGLLCGIDVKQPVRDWILACLEQGLLITAAGAQTLRLTPALIVQRDDIDIAIERLRHIATIQDTKNS